VLAVAVSVALLLAPAAFGSSSRYLLRHPRRERCRGGYGRKTVLVKRTAGGRAVSVREVFCVRKQTPRPPSPESQPVTPQPVAPAPSPPPSQPPKETPKGPYPTTTTLELGERECGSEKVGALITYYCIYPLWATVSGNGAPVKEVEPSFQFTNPAHATENEFSSAAPTRIEVVEEVDGSSQVTSVYWEKHGLVSTVDSKQRFSVSARFSGNAGFEASQSAPAELAP